MCWINGTFIYRNVKKCNESIENTKRNVKIFFCNYCRCERTRNLGRDTRVSKILSMDYNRVIGTSHSVLHSSIYLERLGTWSH